MELLLASASPRRRELLESIGVAFRCVKAPPLDEAATLASAHGTWPERLQQLALAKGSAVAAVNPDGLVLSADTEVLLDGASLGKPANAVAAREMLARLSARSHVVCTAIALQHAASGLRLAGSEATEVRFAPLDAVTIDSYIERAQPFDFAGGYAIQGLGALLITGISGDYSNVVGLPLRLTAELLRQAGMQIL